MTISRSMSQLMDVTVICKRKPVRIALSSDMQRHRQPRGSPNPCNPRQLGREGDDVQTRDKASHPRFTIDHK